MGNELIDAAIDYMQRGLRVLALSGKTPNVKVHRSWSYKTAFYAPMKGHGAHFGYEFDSDCPLCAMEAAFNHPDTTGIGILTGPVYYVVDIDGPEGAQEWRDIVGDEDFIPDRWVAKTGRGLHLWFSHYEEWPTVKLGSKLDFKGFGGYVAAPPSLHPNGHRYEWLLAPGEGDTEAPWIMPDALVAELSARRFAKQRFTEDTVVRAKEREALRADGNLVQTTDFGGIILAVKQAKAGDRNNMLNWAAYLMATEGADDDDFSELAQAASEVDLSSVEINRTIRSARKAARG